MDKVKKTDWYECGNVLIEITHRNRINDMDEWKFNMYEDGLLRISGDDVLTEANKENMNNVLNEILYDYVFVLHKEGLTVEQFKKQESLMEQRQNQMKYIVRNGKRFFLFQHKPNGKAV